MRILLISNLYPPHFVGGYELAAARNARALAAVGIEVVALTTESPARNPVGEVSTDGVRVIRRLRMLPGAYPDFPVSSGADGFNASAATAEIERVRPDLVWIWNPSFLGGGFFDAIRLSAIPAALFLSDLTVAALPEIPRDLPTAFASSALLAASLPHGYRRDRAEVLPHWIDLPAESAALESDEVLFAGRLMPDKGVDTLLEAAALMKRPCRLTFAGQGSAREIRRRADALGLERVSVVGAVDEMDAWFRECSVAALPTKLFEAQSLTPLEAMAWGVPTVTTRLGGNTCYFRPAPLCREIPPDDPAAMAAELDALIGSPDLRREWGRRGREGVQARFSREAILPKTRAWLERIAS